MDVKVTLHFEKGYIAHPYWPQRERVINIQKVSGMNRAKSEAKRADALNAHLKTLDMTREQYDQLLGQADRQFYTVQDQRAAVNGHQPDEIVIPAHQMYGCLAQGADQCPSRMRIAQLDQIRSVISLSDFYTGKEKRDGAWERFATVTGGTGQKLSNQRALRCNDYIANFDATGQVHYTGEDEQKLRDFLDWVGREVGVGASRKMDWGRFTISDWALLS
mgnify:CR=1 FL=1